MTPRDRWLAAAAAYSLLYRAQEARTSTECTALVERAAARLSGAGLYDLAQAADEIASDWSTTTDDWNRLVDGVARASGRLEEEAIRAVA